MNVYVIISVWFEEWEVLDVTSTKEKAYERIVELDPSAKQNLYYDMWTSVGANYYIIEKQLI